MKTTKEQRAELRRLASSRTVLNWPKILDLLDDFDELYEAVHPNDDRTVERLQKWFTTHGHPEFAHDPQPLEQLAAIVIEEYEKRRKA